MSLQDNSHENLLLSNKDRMLQRFGYLSLNSFLFLITSVSTLAVLFIIFFIAKDALPFFELKGFGEFFTSLKWYPSQEPGNFGALSIFYGTGIVTFGAVLVAVPLGIAAAVCLSDILSFEIRQYVKPVIEILAAIPSVAYGFFALVILAPILQDDGGRIIGIGVFIICTPILTLINVIASDLIADKIEDEKKSKQLQYTLLVIFEFVIFCLLWLLYNKLATVEIISGANAFNVSLILGIMALPTIVSVSEDALQAVGRELREGSYALGATRAETIVKVILPAASSGIFAAIILGIMRAIGETMVVWMASGNAAQIPEPWYNFFEPIRTLTATIAGDMGEADHVTGSARYHVLFAMALCLLIVSFISNFLSEWFVVRSRKKLKGQ